MMSSYHDFGVIYGIGAKTSVQLYKISQEYLRIQPSYAGFT